MAFSTTRIFIHLRLFFIVFLAIAALPDAADRHQGHLYENDYVLDVHHSGRRRLTAVRCFLVNQTTLDDSDSHPYLVCL